MSGLTYARDIVRAIARYRSAIRSRRRYALFAEYYVDRRVNDRPNVRRRG